MLLQGLPSVNPSDQIINPVAEIHPLMGVIVTILVIVIGWLTRQHYTLSKDNKELNEDVKQLAKSNVEVLATLNNVAEKMIDSMNNLHQSIDNSITNKHLILKAIIEKNIRDRND